jgi:hypothetical protein
LEAQQHAKDALARVEGLKYMLRNLGSPNHPYNRGLDKQTLKDDLKVAREELRKAEARINQAGQ